MSGRKDKKRKRPRPLNKYEAEKKTASISASAKKIKTANMIHVPEEQSIRYRILNFITVFSAISEHVKCKVCDSNVEFKAGSSRGLGLKILIVCPSCNPISIPLIGPAYEINRRFIFAMRLLGIGLNGARQFCGLMDLPPPVVQSTYYIIIKNIHKAASSVCDFFLRQTVKEEIKETCIEKECEDTSELMVSGDGT